MNVMHPLYNAVENKYPDMQGHTVLGTSLMIGNYFTHDMLYICSFIHHINYIPRRKSGIYWIQVRRAAAAAAAVEISLWTR